MDGAQPPLGPAHDHARPRPPHARLEGRRDRLRLGLAAPPPPRRPSPAQRRPSRGHALRAPGPQHDHEGKPDAPDPGDGSRHAGRALPAGRGARAQAALRDLRVAGGRLRLRPHLPRDADPPHRPDPARTGRRVSGRQAARRHAPAVAQGAAGDLGGRRRLGASLHAGRRRRALLGVARADGRVARSARGAHALGPFPRICSPAARKAVAQLPDAPRPLRHGRPSCTSCSRRSRRWILRPWCRSRRWTST